MLPRIYKSREDFFTKKRTKYTKPRHLRNPNLPILMDKLSNGFIEYFIKKGFFSQNYPCKNGTAYLKIPEKFSFSSNPEGTLKVLQQLIGMYQNRKINTIYLDHTDCNELDLSASLLMDAILYEIDCHRKLLQKPISFRGQFKHAKDDVENESMLGLLICSGVLKHLGVLQNVTIPDHIRIFDLYDQYIKMHKNIPHADAGKKVAEYFNSCYKICNFSISDIGLNKITNLVSEIVLNCDNHSNNPKRWFCQGHFTMLPNKRGTEKLGVCQLSIISIGNTFYESIYDCGTKFIKERLERQYNKVTASWKNVFGLISDKKKKELFYLLYCLQENISRFIENENNGDRGKGTATLFTNFQDLGKTSNGEEPILSITSGCGNIIFDGKYRMDAAPGYPKVIAFNEDNDLNKPPDKNYVHTIDASFPGVIINLKFYIDEKYINTLLSNTRKND
ncbi:hypothetical protein [Phascolarctobacterium succinatutens]|mgnify:CR=1 FL=1|uniref:hypothetical protein n=1 Tax=Phascolarctobacterium succinatutens TaxID=626940 RepID=UPI003FD736F0